MDIYSFFDVYMNNALPIKHKKATICYANLYIRMKNIRFE